MYMVLWKPRSTNQWFKLYNGRGYEEDIAKFVLDKFTKKYPAFIFKIQIKE